MKKKNHFWLRLGSALLDISAIYCLASLMQLLIYKFAFIAFGYLFIIVFISYYLLSYLLLKGKSPAKLFTGLKITRINEQKATPATLIIREVILKGLVGIIIPLYIFENVPMQTNSLVVAGDLLLVVVVSALFLLLVKRTWWEWLSETTTIKDQTVTKTQLKYACFALVILYISVISISVSPLLINNENLITQLPTPYPRNKEVKQYADYIKNHSQDPVDYIFGLFKKYDIVVISERMHPEYTQYDFIFKILKDKRFSEGVGNIFTECGSVSYQDTLDNYLHTNYQTEDELNRATAILQRNSSAIWPLWSNTNLFDMLKTVNTLNCTLPDSSKINWYFTDLPVNWETATHETYIKGYTNPGRDSLMAAQVIEKYNSILSHQRRQKALVIMNTYHGYGLAPDGKNYFGATTEYIMKALPGKVANVMMNTISMKYAWVFVPVVNGKWDAAFEMAGNPDAGFNFDGSPFGDDPFDARLLRIKGLMYKDVFTGYIFYNPFSKHFYKDGFPYIYENAEEEMIKRGACVDQQYAEMIRNSIENQKAHPGEPYTTGPTKLPLFYNLIHMLAIPLLVFITMIIIVILYFRKRKQIVKLQLTSLPAGQ